MDLTNMQDKIAYNDVPSPLELEEHYQMVVEAYNLSTEPYATVTSQSQLAYPTAEDIKQYLTWATEKLHWGRKRLHVKKTYVLKSVPFVVNTNLK